MSSPTGRAGDALKRLADLGNVAMAGDVVRGEIVGRLAEHQRQLGLAPRAAHARFRVGDEVIEIDGFGFDERQEAELDGGRVAARVAYDAGGLDRCAVHLGQTVDRLRGELGRGVVELVPLLPLGEIAQAEIRGEIDDLHPSADQPPGIGHRDAVRRSEENDVAPLEIRFPRFDEGEIHAASQRGKHVGDASARLRARGDRRDFDLRMLRQKPQQLDTGVAGAADDSDLDHSAGPTKFPGPAGPPRFPRVHMSPCGDTPRGD